MWTSMYPCILSNDSVHLYISPRPRGNDWLVDELRFFRRCGIDILASALTSEENEELELNDEASLCRDVGLEFRMFPIQDRQNPDSFIEFDYFTLMLSHEVQVGRSVLIHCRQGIGRSSMLAAGCLVHWKGVPVLEALQSIEQGRGRPVPDTQEQVEWLLAWQSWREG